MTVSLTRKERLVRSARGEEVDHIPTLGGWIGGPRTLSDLAGLTMDAFLADPLAGGLRAHLALGVDGMVPPVVPTRADQIRTGAILEEDHPHVEPEALRDYAETLPATEREILADFRPEEQERGFRDHFVNARRDWGGIEPIANYWELGGHFPLYTQFGYVAFLTACQIYPEAVERIWWTRSIVSRERARILARLYRELDLVPVLFCGEDLCNNQGPMVSPGFLRAHYFPHVKMVLEPLVEAGVRVVHHCDGDVRPLVQDFLDTGFSGFQGFQYELGVDPAELRRLRSPFGQPILIFGGLSVTRTLPFGTPDDARAEVDYLLDATDGGRGLFLFTSNVTGAEVPAANLRAAYAHAREAPVFSAASPARPVARRPWPGWRLGPAV